MVQVKMEGVCAACLTVGRRLAPLKIDASTFSSWFGVNITNPICWECQATLFKFMSFRNRVIVAQDTLQKCEAKFQSLSRLSYVNKDSYDEIIIQGIKTEGLDCLIEFGDKDTDDDDEHNIKLENKNKCLCASYCKTVVNSTCDEVIIEGIKRDALNCGKDGRDKDCDENYAQNVKVENISKCLSASYCKTVVYAKQKVNNKVQKIKEKAKKQSNNYYKIKQLTMEEVEKIRRDDLAAERYMNSLHKCHTCILGYGIKTIWKSHNSRLHSVESGSHICNICQQRFKKEDILKKHYDAHFKCYVCLHCDFAHPRLNVIQDHYLKTHNKDGFRCNKCPTDYIFPTHGRLNYHQKTVHRKRHICPVDNCGKTFITNYVLKNHMLRHNGGTPRFECPFCHKLLKGANNMSAHMRKHTDPSPPAPTETLYCITCDKKFTSQIQYDRHIKYSAPHRNPDVVKFQCADCGKRFMTKHLVEDHVRSVHLNRREFVCNVCNKTFNTIGLLKRHLKSHDEPREKVRDKVCEQCGKAFVGKRNLEEHMNSHTGARPFECQVCGDRFSYSAALFNHNRLKHEHYKRKKKT